VQVILVEATTRFVEIPSVYPVRICLTVAPDTKPVPARFVMETGPVFGAVWGVTDERVGVGGGVGEGIVKPTISRALLPTLVTETYGLETKIPLGSDSFAPPSQYFLCN
jgi:hypothetical protein